MASPVFLTYHDGKIEIPEELQQELHLKEGVRLRIAYSSRNQIIIRPENPQSDESPHDWRSLRGILSHLERDLNAELNAERIRENEHDARWS